MANNPRTPVSDEVRRRLVTDLPQPPAPPYAIEHSVDGQTVRYEAPTAEELIRLVRLYQDEAAGDEPTDPHDDINAGGIVMSRMDPPTRKEPTRE